MHSINIDWLTASGFATNSYTLLCILGLAAITVLTRSLFFLSDKEWKLPNWFSRGLHYAPIAALAAVVAPEVFLQNGKLITHWQNAHLYAAAVGLACYYWKRDVLYTIVGGMLVYLLLHLRLGW